MRGIAAFLLTGLIFFGAAGLGLALADDGGRSTVERRLGSMGTSLDLSVAGPTRRQALAASEAAVQAIEAAERRLSTWRADSELARFLRASAGTPVAISPALAADLSAAISCARETGGAFDPTVGPLVAAWGLRSGGRLPSDREIEAARRATGVSGLRLSTDRESRSVATRDRADLVIDEGGFGKGAALANALEALQGFPEISLATLDFGGQVALYGRQAVRIALADPDRRDREVLEVTVEGGSLSTSGDGERGVVVEGRRIGHLLDPRTGRPAPDFGSLTIWAADPLRADCLSTGLYVLGPEAALAWAEAHPGIEVLALVRGRSGPGEPAGLKALASAGWQGRLRVLVPDLSIEELPHSVTERIGPVGSRN